MCIFISYVTLFYTMLNETAANLNHHCIPFALIVDRSGSLGDAELDMMHLSLRTMFINLHRLQQPM